MIRKRTLSVVLATTGLFLYGFGSASRPGAPVRQERETLSASTDVGRVLDREGVAARRAVLADRWGPADEGTALETGDWLEVGSRGANALKVRLTGGIELTLGPGTLVEVIGGGRIELLRGEVLVDTTRGPEVPEVASLEVRGPGETILHVDGRTVLRARDGALVRLSEAPRWLVGYEANASTEAMGSLLAKVDGRNVPLTIGYHKVTVDIRDQIARTVIEESFENHTSTVLEGVFYFPLPADASISSFGMWVGGELVQGDIVEKQRAREIYETILREKRDPGLLEWTGGNIFKARIYPIGAEKRIRIAYTQVLPMNADTFTYNYALQSELLRKTPLRRLEIEINVSSAAPLAAVECPSHACRIRTGEHAAKIEFAADEFAPERDFELRVRLQPGRERLTVIPHRRGDDGYFMLLIDAPPLAAPPNGSARETEPIELLVLADTSGSMWGAPRSNQVAFIEALIASLGPDDTVNLATVDVETRWAFERPVRIGLEQREQALRFLEQRDPLGWTDLAQAFASACERAGNRTHVVYVGDGVPTTASADPVELAHELGRLFKGKGTFHAVVPGPSSEMTVLRALAGLGGGSVRSIGGGTDPTQTAFALLAELSAPALKNVKVSFEGLAVGAVYPATLPNLTAGGQQIVVGRFDPLASSASGNRAGRVRVTGTVDGAEVSFEREVTLAMDTGEDEGQSFVPRLWARHHLDHLLDQGSSDAVQERIVTLSEDYQIVTPYTSFLVLESDADRERFGVQKRFRMRDGEEFFTAGRESGSHELRRQQMLKARTWRRRLRDRALAALESMGRELTELLRGPETRLALVSAFGYLDVSDRSDWNGLYGGPRDFILGSDEHAASRRAPERPFFETGLEGDKWDYDGDTEGGDRLREVNAKEAFEEERPMVAQERSAMKSVRGGKGGRFRRNEAFGRRQSIGSVMGFVTSPGDTYNGGWYVDPFAALLPTVGPVRASDPTWTWSDEVLELLGRFDRRRWLASSALGWRFATETTRTDARGREQTTRGLHLIGPDRWVTLGSHVEGTAYPVDWMVDGQRGVLLEGWRLGRVRATEAGDERSWSAPFASYFGDHLRSYAAYDARLVERDGARAGITFALPGDETNAFTIELDTERGLLLELVWTVAGERKRGQVFEGFREVGGAWWPTRIRSWTSATDSQSARRETITRIDVEAIGAPELARLAETELARRADAILLSAEEGRVTDAKQAVRDGQAGIEERWLLLRYYAQTQRWDAAEPHLAAFAAATGERPGLERIRLTWLQQSRRNEELRIELARVASELAGTPRDAEYGLATDILQYSYGLNQGNEVQGLLRAIQPVYLRQEITDAELAWDQRWLQALSNMSRPEALLEARREAAGKWPFSMQMQTAFAQLLGQHGEIDQALAWLASAEAEGAPWQTYERSQFRQSVAQILWGGYRLEQWTLTFEAWEREDVTQLDQSLNNQYLSGLIFLDREREAWSRIEAWLALAGKVEREPFEQARLHAAVQHALGQGHQLYHQRFEDARAELLANTARALVQHDDDTTMAGWILQHWLFHGTDAGRALLSELYRKVETSLAELSPKRLQAQIGWLRGASYQTDAGEDAWQVLFERVFQRWLATADERERAPLGQVVQTYGAPGLRVRFFRQLLARAVGEDARIAAAMRLGQELRQQPWSAELERELVSLLTTLAPDEGGEMDEPARAQNLDQRAVALYDLVDWSLGSRTHAMVTALPGYESMSRRTVRTERDKARRTALTGAATLTLELEQTLAPQALGDWAAIERIFLQVENRTELDAAWTRSLELLRIRVDTLAAADEPEAVPLRERILAERCIATCTLLLLRTDEAALEGRRGALLAELERLIECESEFP
ncbi:MAG: hypothetical protein E2O39_03680, partial [Planctomycetota bacterium]